MTAEEEINNIEDINNNLNLEQEQIKNIIIKYYQSHTHEFLERLIDFLLEYTIFDTEDIRDKLVNILELKEDKHIQHIVNYTLETSGENGYKNLQAIMENEDLDELIELLNINKVELDKLENKIENDYEEEIENDNIKSPTIYNGHSKQTPVNYGESEDHKQQQQQNDNQVNTTNKANFLIQSCITLLKPHFQESSYDITKYFSGACFLNNHDVAIPAAVVKELSNNNNEYIEIVKQTYKKGVTEGKKKIKGLSGLENILGGKNSPTLQYLKKILSVNLSDGEDKEEEDKSDFKKVLELTQDTLYFRDQFNNPYIQVNNLNIPLSDKSSGIKDYLNDICWNSEYNFKPSNEALNSVIQLYRSQSKEVYPLELRVAADPKDENVIWYDMGDQTGRSIRISAEGWEIVDNTPILFRRYYSVEYDQVEPNRNYDSNIFDKVLENCFYIKDEKIKHLLKVYITDLFIPETQKPFIMFHGSQDAGKTMKFEFIKMIVDPNKVLHHPLLNDLDYLYRIFSHNYLVYFDNTSGISSDVSDMFCRAVSGDGQTPRLLYTDEDERIVWFKRAIGCAGVNLGTDRGDLISRIINVKYEGIDDKERKDPKEIVKEFKQLKPYLLGYIFDILVDVLRKKRDGIKTKIKKYNRMIEFQQDGELLSMSMGYEDGEFSSIYDKMVYDQNAILVEDSPVATALVDISKRTQKCKDGLGEEYIKYWTADALFKQIKDHIKLTQNIDYDRRKDLPESARKMRNYINRIIPALKKMNVIINYDQDRRGSNGERLSWEIIYDG